LRVKHRQLFRSPPSTTSSSNRLKGFISQADTKGLALYVDEWNAVPRFQNTTLLVFVGFGCRPVWLQLSCPRLAGTAM